MQSTDTPEGLSVQHSEQGLVKKVLASDAMKSSRRVGRRFLAMPKARRLAKHDDERIAAVGRAIMAHSTNAAQRNALTARVEKRREDLLRSTKEIALVDFGAGKANDTRDAAQMDKGVKSMVSVAEVTGYSKSTFWASMVYEIVRELQPESSIEMGTCVGISAAYQSKALQQVGSNGRLVTLEGSPATAELAHETFSTLGIDNVSVVVGPFNQTLIKALKEASPVNYLFNDGHHDGDAILKYFEMSLPYLAEDAVIVFDDIAWSDSMKRGWQKIMDHPRVCATIDLKLLGIAFLGQGPSKLREQILL